MELTLVTVTLWMQGHKCKVLTLPGHDWELMDEILSMLDAAHEDCDKAVSMDPTRRASRLITVQVETVLPSRASLNESKEMPSCPRQ
jgi:hypothetical protein